MNNIGVVITDGVGYRNFILSGFIEEAGKEFDSVVIYSFLPASIYSVMPPGCKIVEMEADQETFPLWAFRKTKELAHLQNHRKGNFGIQDTLMINYPKGNNRRARITKLLYRLTSLFHGESAIRVYSKCQDAILRKKNITRQFAAMLKENRTKIIFFTHQRPAFIAPLIVAAKSNNIKTSAFIFSWDNLASKGRMAGDFNYYLVWSELMKADLLEFYPNVKEENIAVVGTPQFEPYVMKKYGYEKAEFIREFSINPDIPTIFFTCNDSTSLNDPIYLDILAKAIRDKKIAKMVNLIVRTSPAEGIGRFEKLREKYPFIVWNNPKWELTRENHPEPWSQRIPSAEDVSDLKALLEYSDIAINVLSTITIDSFLFDKPVVNPVFGNAQNDMFDDQKFLNYRHLQNLVKSNASHITLDEQAFISTINKLITEGDDKSPLRKSFCDLQIGKPLQGTSARIAKQIKDWAP